MSAGPLQALGALRFALELVADARTDDARTPLLARAIGLLDSLGEELVAVAQAAAAIESRRSQDASRQRRRRSRDNPPRHVTSRDVTEGGKGGGVSSDPESDPDPICDVGESEGECHVTSRDSGVRVLPEAPVAALRPLPPQMRELAEGVAMSGGPFDVGDAWLGFQTSGKPQNAGEWQRWCARAVTFAKRDRQRDKDRPRGPSVTRAEPGYQQPPPVWKGHAEPAGGAVPPPRDLLACLPGGRR